MISELIPQYCILLCYSSRVYSDLYFAYIKFIYLYKILKPSSTIAAHRLPELCVEFKLDECWVLFTAILACNVKPDNDGFFMVSSEA